MRRISIHHNPAVDWQRKRLPYMRDGLERLGFDVTCTESRKRLDDAPAVLFGTSNFRRIEAERGEWLLVDRASVGDPDYVSLVWNGHGLRGDHRVPESFDSSRWHELGVALETRPKGDAVVICGQLEPFTSEFGNMAEWYSTIEGATHFRPHPTGCVELGLPHKTDWDDIDTMHVLSSSVAVDALIHGVNVQVHDRTSMAHNVTDRDTWAHWLAWTQWSWDEIAQGDPIEHVITGHIDEVWS